MPRLGSCSRVRSNPIRTRACRLRDERADARGPAGDRERQSGQTQASVVPGRHVLADPGPQRHGQPVPLGQGQQPVDGDVLDVARVPGGDGGGAGRDRRAGRAAGAACGSTARVFRSTVRMMWSTWIECARWSAKNTSMARLTNSSTMATADREPRELLDALAAGDADVEQAGRAVDERRDEDAQHDLVRPVAQEVAQQPGRELRRRQLQRHHGQAEQQRDDRHHRAGDRDQQGPGVVRRALERQPRRHRSRGTWDRTMPSRSADTAAIAGRNHSDPRLYSRSASRRIIRLSSPAPAGLRDRIANEPSGRISRGRRLPSAPATVTATPAEQEPGQHGQHAEHGEDDRDGPGPQLDEAGPVPGVGGDLRY